MNRRRFVFRGNAAAFGGHIIRPKDIVLEAPGASSLPVTGGRSTAKIPRTQFEEFFKVESATTFAEGLFEDRKQFLKLTNHEVDEDTLVTSTVVRVDVRGMTVGRKPRLTVKQLQAELRGRSPLVSGQPALQISQASIDGIDIDGHRLAVEFNTKPFQRYDTHAKLLAAADDPAMAKDLGRWSATHGTIFTTIVKSIKWDGKPFPGSKIEGNAVTLPEFGQVFFGELLISELSRRLTIIRMALGSDSGGSASGGDVETNGMWSP